MEIRDHCKDTNTGPKVILIGDFNGAMDNFCQVDIGPYTSWDVKINRATVNSSTDHCSLPGPVFPSVLTGP